MANQTTAGSTNSSTGTTAASATPPDATPQRRSPEPKVMSNTLGVLLKREYDKNQCREVVTLKPDMDYQIGTVLGRINASSECMPLKASGADGSQIAVGVLIEDPDLTNYAQSHEPLQGLMLARGPAIVSADALIFDDAVDEAKRKTALSQLAALGIVARTAA